MWVKGWSYEEKGRTCINNDKVAKRKGNIDWICSSYTIAKSFRVWWLSWYLYTKGLLYFCNRFFFFSILVFDDLGEITRRHFKDLQTLVRQRRSQEAEQAPPRYPVAYNAPQQPNHYSTLQHSRQPTNYYQTGPVQQHPPAPPLSGYSAGHY